MIKVLEVPYNIVRGLIRFAFNIIVYFFALLIYLFTYEPHKKNCITTRKAKRIRVLTKLKVWFFNVVPDSVIRYLGKQDYKDYLFSHLNHGVQLCDEGTDRCAV